MSHTYTPRCSARVLLECQDPEVLIVGPSGTGKSRAALEKVHLAALLNPGLRALMVRKTAVSLAASGVQTWKRDVVPEALAAGLLEFYGGSPQEPAEYRYRNGSVLVLGGMDRHEKVLSTDYDLIFVQEATELTVDDWEALSSRLRSDVLSFQQLLADCNPSHEKHWLKLRCDSGQTRMLLSRHEDNPLIFDMDDSIDPPSFTVTEKGEAYIARLDALTGPRKQRLRYGKWSSAEGVIYETYDPALHLLDPFPIPDDWTRYWSVDFGYTNPMVVQSWAEDPDSRLYMYREWYRTGRTVEQFCDDILRLVAPAGDWVEPKPRVVVCGHDSDRQGTSMRDILARSLRLSTKPAYKDVKVGIQAVESRLQVAGDGRPRLFLLRGAVVDRDEALLERAKPTCTEDELPGYVWDSTPGKEPKETPVKVDDHGCDALRYMVMHFHRGKRTVRHSSGSVGQLPTRIG